jgi:stage V sporulation protein SpoVS
MSDPAPVSSTAPAPATPDKILRVGGGTDCKKLAFAIVGVLEREHARPILEFVGAGACAQAVKAVAIANSHLARSGKFLTALPTFVHREVKDNADLTGLQLILFTHNH